jgi:hypothetical protein
VILLTTALSTSHKPDALVRKCLGLVPFAAQLSIIPKVAIPAKALNSLRLFPPGPSAAGALGHSAARKVLERLDAAAQTPVSAPIGYGMRFRKLRIAWSVVWGYVIVFFAANEGSHIWPPAAIFLVVASMLAVVPWFPTRFTLRTMLIATTLIGVVLAFIVWAVR